MTGAWKRLRPRECPERRSQHEVGGVRSEAQSKRTRARARLRARAKLRASLLLCRVARRYLWVSMATGRGRMLRQRSLGLQALRGSTSGGSAACASAGAALERSGFRKDTGVKFTGSSCALRQQTRRGQHNGRTSPTCSVFLEKMPSEILLKIFSYLDAMSLLCTGCVSRRFYHLANDNFIWIRIYSTAFSSKRSHWKVNSVEETAASVSLLSVKDKEVGYWKKEYIKKQISSVKAALAHILKPVNPYTGLPVKTKEALRPRWLSLIAKYDLSHLSKYTMIGCDRLVRIFSLNPGLMVGLWQKEDGLAFVIANLHFHHLVERSTLGSATLPYVLPPHCPFVDDNPEYGLQGYQLHIDMHGGGLFYLCSTFRNLFSSKGCIENGYVKFMVIDFNNNREHLPLIGKVGLAWRTNIFDGFIESCSVVDVTLLDEHRKPFWCMSSPVCMNSATYPSGGPSFLGHTYYVNYMDADGGVHAELVWIEETEEYFIVSLVLYLSVAKINHWFGTKY